MTTLDQAIDELKAYMERHKKLFEIYDIHFEDSLSDLEFEAERDSRCTDGLEPYDIVYGDRA